MKFVVTGQGHQGSEAWAQRKVDLFGRFDPDVDVEDFLPLRLEVVTDAQPGALKKDSPNE